MDRKVLHSILLAAYVIISPITLQAQWNMCNVGPYGPCNFTGLVNYDNAVFAGSCGGSFLSIDGGNSWIKYIDEFGGYYSYAKIGNILLTAIINNLKNDQSGIFRSIDSGRNWSKFESGLTDTIVHSLTVFGNKVFAGTHSGLFRSIDSGASWSEIDSSPADLDLFVIKNENIFASNRSAIYRSKDSGTSWTKVSSDIKEIRSLVYNGDDLFAGATSNKIQFPTRNDMGIFKSDDNGTSWSKVANIVVSSLVMSENNMFVANDSGIFLSTDSGTSWTDISVSILPYPHPCFCLVIVKNDLFASVGYRGSIWRRSLPEILQAVSSKTLQYSHAHQTGLNIISITNSAFSLNIKFALPHTEKVFFTVFNLAGNRTNIFCNKHFEGGCHILKLDTRNISGGYYVFKIEAGSNSYTKGIQFPH